MNYVIRHRGPDGEGYLLLDDTFSLHCASGEDTSSSIWTSFYEYAPDETLRTLQSKFFNLAFGHHRLSILDLSSAGNKPMSYANYDIG